MDKRFWGILVAVVIVLGGIFWATSGKNNTTSTSQPTNHVEGQGQAKVTLVEYGDYECPFCGAYYPVVKQVVTAYSPYIYFQFRNLPLTSLHPNAFAGARAAEAASLQGKFWQMHDALYDNQDPTGRTGWVASSDPLDQYFVGFAQQIGLNVTQFKTDFASSKVNSAINADVAAFAKTGAQEATPTFFLDGKQVQPTETVASFEQVLNAEIKAKTGSVPAIANLPSSGSGASGQSVQ